MSELNPHPPNPDPKNLNPDPKNPISIPPHPGTNEFVRTKRSTRNSGNDNKQAMKSSGSGSKGSLGVKRSSKKNSNRSKGISKEMEGKAYGRASFARVLVEVDAEKELVDNVEVCYESLGKSMNLRVEYAWKPPHCTHCRVFRHEYKMCNKREITLEERADKGKGVESNNVKNSDRHTYEMKWQEVRKGGNNGASTSRDLGQQINNYYGNRGGFNNRGRGGMMGRGGVMGRGGMNQRYGKEVSNVRNVMVENVGKKVDDGLVLDGNNKGKGVPVAIMHPKNKNKKQNDIATKNSFDVLAGRNNNEVEVGSDEWCQMRKKIDLACDLGMQIAESEKLRWSKDLKKYFDDKCTVKANSKLVEGLKWRISKLQKDISYGHTNIAMNAKLKADELCKEIMKETGISRIASRVGNPIIMDRITTSMCEKAYGRASFARVLVEVDAEKELVDNVEVCYESLGKSMNLRVEYAWKPPHCTHCRVFGHEYKMCNKREITLEERADKGKGVESNNVKNSDGYTDEMKWQEVRKGGNNGASTSRDLGQQSNSYYGNRGGFNNRGRGGMMGRGSVMGRGGVNQRYGKEVSNVRNVMVENVGKKVDDGLVLDGNNKGKGVPVAKMDPKNKNKKQNDIATKNSFDVLAGGNNNEVEVGSDEWCQMRKKIDLACDLGMQIAESEKLRWSKDLKKYFDDKCTVKANSKLVEGLKWRISKLQKDISYGHTNIAMNAKLKADELCKEIMKETAFYLDDFDNRWNFVGVG
ncbi:ATPase, F1/V1/A1 complex, alpha/beta subunit, Zinc knuckle CX2CX4HX4C [Artemisia annua]|uniref:ATPase, F1/V1/A1 complex, alpha/beta subunit, Zinc knuckle CX2CX4HX4C n=1 Tax=Artemisia annua TaxID=35608 RepID=A0A2U1MRB8_ARTAN|nr:ATPase, F1/V1/A1 complex, alpha/beta subunit, Zinc knuckle CX2CX4HX4C [Artemisia annua]